MCICSLPQADAAGIRCVVVAPSKLSLTQGRIKNDHRDAVVLARLLRAGDVVPIWMPDPVHEAIGDLVHTRQTASFDVRKARQRIQSYLLLRDRHFTGKPWSSLYEVTVKPLMRIASSLKVVAKLILLCLSAIALLSAPQLMDAQGPPLPPTD